MKLFKRLKELKSYRKEYKIKPVVKCGADDRDYYFSLAPTITFQPWIYRQPRDWVVDIWWLHFHICVGEWECVDNG